MKKNLSLITLGRMFMVGILLIIGGFCAFLAYLYIEFYGPLTGDITVDAAPELLSNLQAKKFETAVKRDETRRSLPDIPDDLPDPYTPR